MKSKIAILVIIVALVISVSFTLRSNKATVEKNVYRPDVERKIVVRSGIVKREKIDHTLSYTGTFAPYRESMLIPQFHGEVEGVFFDEGDVVTQGQTLVEIDNDIVRAQYQAAEANYQTAKRNLARYQNASVSGGVSNLQLDNLKLNLSTSESQVKQLARQIEQSKITAPFTGTMTLRSVEPGSVAGGTAVARISDLSQLKLEIAVPEKEVVMFKAGEKAEIYSDVYPDQVLFGTIEYVSDRADAAHNYTVKIVLKNHQDGNSLKAGMYGTAVLRKKSENSTLTIPRSALLGSAKNPQVFVVKDGKATLTNIMTGFSTDESVEVLTGVHEGDVVVTTGHINLADGVNVSVVK
jgi:RND family efflux transporter MFP subunit